jgi:hypothetical protein
MSEKKVPPGNKPLPPVTCNWCDHRTDEVAGHVVTAEGEVTQCPFIDIGFIKSL